MPPKAQNIEIVIVPFTLLLSLLFYIFMLIHTFPATGYIHWQKRREKTATSTFLKCDFRSQLLDKG